MAGEPIEVEPKGEEEEEKPAEEKKEELEEKIVEAVSIALKQKQYDKAAELTGLLKVWEEKAKPEEKKPAWKPTE